MPSGRRVAPRRRQIKSREQRKRKKERKASVCDVWGRGEWTSWSGTDPWTCHLNSVPFRWFHSGFLASQSEGFHPPGTGRATRRLGGGADSESARVQASEPLASIFLVGTLKYYPLVYGGGVLLTVHSSPANFQLCVLCLLLLRSWWILIEIEIVVVVVFLPRLCLKSIFKNLHSVSSFLFTLPPSTLASIHQKWK